MSKPTLPPRAVKTAELIRDLIVAEHRFTTLTNEDVGEVLEEFYVSLETWAAETDKEILKLLANSVCWCDGDKRKPCTRCRFVTLHSTYRKIRPRGD